MDAGAAPPRTVTFNLGALAAAPSRERDAASEQRVPLVTHTHTHTHTHAREVEAVGTYVQSTPLEQLPEPLRFGKMDGCTPLFRASWVRAAFMKLGITGIIAALVAGTTPNRNAAWSCALSAAVNAVACVHYWLVWGIRAQSMPTGYEHFASGRTLQGGWTGRKRADDFKQLDRDRMFAQELAVDGLRHSDWVVTLWVMTLELYHLAEYASDKKEPAVRKFLAMALVPFVVLGGVAYRFYANELRVGKDLKTIHPAQWAFGLVGFLAGCGLMVPVMMGILSPVWDNDAITGDKQYDRDAVIILTLVWWGYPLVSCVSRLMLIGTPGNEYTGNAGWFKDATYAFLDVTSKGGLALYVALRTTWLAAV